ncbi:hypothetical protein V493_02527 [Pseudogymnoascus sp. VKM F-4281 (FW-2241)]|nr:hypothetical protein V493_02527 [Pseudogymnoascus sp. VKM F-4281 (FW-2241)]
MKSGALLLLPRKGNPRPPHLNGSQLSFARPSTLAMADEPSNQRYKRCLANESAYQSATSRCQEVHRENRLERDQRMSPKKVAEVVETLVEALNKRKRQRLNKVGTSRPAGWLKALADEWDAKPSDPVATDKSDIERELRHWSKAYAAWEREDSKREWKHWEVNYFSPERTPRLLSEVLAAVAGVHQIDLLPETSLSTVREQTLRNTSSEPASYVEIDAETTPTA